VARTGFGRAAADLYDKPEVVTKLREYFQFGEDPYHYPVLGRDLIASDAKQLKAHMSLFKKWLKDGVTGRLGASAHDLIRVVTTLPSTAYADQSRAARNIVEFAGLLIDNKCIDLGKAVLETTAKSVLAKAIGLLFSKTKQFDKLADMLLGVNELKAAVSAADTGKP
jgi:hypothetical protein